MKDNALVADKAVCEGSVCEDAVVRGEVSIKSKAICMGHSLICDSAIVSQQPRPNRLTGYRRGLRGNP